MSKESFKKSYNSGFTAFSNSLFDFMRKQDLTSSESLVLIYFYSYRNFSRHYTSRTQISKDLGISRITISNAINKFIERKFIEIEQTENFFKVRILITQDQDQEDSFPTNNDADCDKNLSTPDKNYTEGVIKTFQHRKNIHKEDIKNNMCIREGGVDTHSQESSKYIYQKEENETNAYQSKELMDHWEQCGLEVSDNENIKYNALKTLIPQVAKLKRDGHTLETLKNAVSNYAKEFLDKDSIYKFKYKINGFFATNGKGDCPAVKFSDLFYCENNFKKHVFDKNSKSIGMTDDEKQKMIDDLAAEFGDQYR